MRLAAYCTPLFRSKPLIYLKKLFAQAQSVIAKVAELVDALDLGSSGVTRESSSLSFRTSQHAVFFNKPIAADYQR